MLLFVMVVMTATPGQIVRKETDESWTGAMVVMMVHLKLVDDRFAVL